MLTQPGDTILDPYCGSGTTLLEASVLGRKSIGVDLNPVACLISKVKVMKVSDSKLKELESFWGSCLQQFLDSDSSIGNTKLEKAIIKKVENDFRLSDPWFTKWFNTRNLFHLLIIDNLINELDEDEKEISKLVLSDILRRSSNSNNSYPNIMFDKNKINKFVPIKLYLGRLSQVCEQIRETSKVIKEKPLIINGCNNDLNVRTNTIDAVITHPPYIGSIPYAEYGMLGLEWFGYSSKELDKNLTGGQRQKRDVVERFENGFNKMIAESYRVLKKDKYLFMQLGNPTVKGEEIDLEEMAIKLAKSNGFKHACTHYREGINRRANKMGKESLVFFQK